ncbi:uncharacterized protein PG986_003318 [Apiospora aurea]|uniref:Uncharacterized protein n=1 Tax=Apiospora aurea TaxID=335848 RepID=A0ABR1QRC5_9PEZI
MMNDSTNYRDRIPVEFGTICQMTGDTRHQQRESKLSAVKAIIVIIDLGMNARNKSSQPAVGYHFFLATGRSDLNAPPSWSPLDRDILPHAHAPDLGPLWSTVSMPAPAPVAAAAAAPSQVPSATAKVLNQAIPILPDGLEVAPHSNHPRLLSPPSAPPPLDGYPKSRMQRRTIAAESC